ncbi:MAG: hypothetical protein AAB651_01365 [Patescibacteria group bacterium]
MIATELKSLKMQGEEASDVCPVCREELIDGVCPKCNPKEESESLDEAEIDEVDESEKM